MEEEIIVETMIAFLLRSSERSTFVMLYLRGVKSICMQTEDQKWREKIEVKGDKKSDPGVLYTHVYPCMLCVYNGEHSALGEVRLSVHFVV